MYVLYKQSLDLRRQRLVSATIAGQLDVLCDNPGHVRSEFTPKIVHDWVSKELQPKLLIAVVEDPEKSWPYISEVRLHGLLTHRN